MSKLQEQIQRSYINKLESINQPMIIYIENNQVRAEFSLALPAIGTRDILPSDSKETKSHKKKYPLYVRKDLLVRLTDKMKHKVYCFEIKKDLFYDGASINRLFWRAIGSNTDIKFRTSSLIHDCLCLDHEIIDNDRYFSTCVFNCLNQATDTWAFTRWMMKHSVDNWQKFCGWRNK